ncbi:ribonuclease III [Geitlerinema sp. PCC 7407]|uniref:ribonuclease III n=1 Tax=Geitlerinema sp. PCC 7407 TaxID=1173025 RepID=UPI00029FBE65|nr:ribonuclease III [Geitlerinema sp. PCC 7407]AFY65026.1 RNAse III [Geitlerinema sp. PCC 7407]
MSLPDPRRQKQLMKLLERLELPPDVSVRWDLLDLALTHSTVSPTENYEQLEFMGDAVVRLATAEFLMETYPDWPVGEFAALRSILVSDRRLAQIADRYGFDRFLLVGSSVAGNRAGQETRLAESFEAVLGALYLSTHDLSLVRPWLDTHLQEFAEEIRSDPARQNYKAALQEWTQARYQCRPEYQVQEVSQIYNDTKRFRAEVWVRDRHVGSGSGRSIKAAEQAAAQEAFLLLSQSSNPDLDSHLA